MQFHVIARSARPNILVDETSLNKVVKLTDSIGMVYSGMGPDSRCGPP